MGGEPLEILNPTRSHIVHIWTKFGVKVSHTVRFIKENSSAKIKMYLVISITLQISSGVVTMTTECLSYHVQFVSLVGKFYL